jgi:hypothetical protein
VTTDAEAFFFLHDLISSYLKEKERVLSIQQKTMDSFQSHYTDKSQPTVGKVSSENFKSSTPANEGDKETKTNKDKKHKIDPLHNDWRRFECNTWHLEPTVRLISTFGSQIEPYGVDLILSKLGFSHARTTIPKWLQRGCMDPMDKIMSFIILNAIQSVKEDAKQSKQNAEQSLGNDINSASTAIPKYNSASINSSVSPYSSTPTTTSKVKSNNKYKPKAFR